MYDDLAVEINAFLEFTGQLQYCTSTFQKCGATVHPFHSAAALVAPAFGS